MRWLSPTAQLITSPTSLFALRSRARPGGGPPLPLLPLYAPAEPAAEFARLSYKDVYRVEALSAAAPPLQIGHSALPLRNRPCGALPRRAWPRPGARLFTRETPAILTASASLPPVLRSSFARPTCRKRRWRSSRSLQASFRGVAAARIAAEAGWSGL